MIDYFDSRNRVDQNLLRTQYQTLHDTTSSPRPFYKYTRIRTRTYSYVGLSRAAAESCVAALQTLYTRRFPIWEWSGNKWRIKSGTDAYSAALVAQIQAVRTDGEMYQVDVQLDETAEIYMMSPSVDLAASFSFYGYDFDYDED